MEARQESSEMESDQFQNRYTSYTIFNNMLLFVFTVSIETVTLCSHLVSVMAVSKKSDNPKIQ